ncbi:UspA domain-containing protein [Caballeronia terrestris]|uniref:UspA domain-containing protein n=2 Tax=Caballeronia TaxID=1827195 RepID=A0A158KT15_9BURK|nr:MULTISPECIES: universal stress protein [Caballeronia]SAL68881.1 UspA domain-containing protein [Caballeronia humi]SAL84257.1 UspA domain-containing protein [Caballeronia terrestris]
MNQPASPHSPSARFSRLLLCVDSSIASIHAATYACQLGVGGVQIRVVSVLEIPRALLPIGWPTGLNIAAFSNELRESANVALSKVRRIFEDHGLTVEAELIDLARYGGDVSHALASEAQRWNADLLVLGARQHHGLLRWVEGAVSGPVTKLVKCPVIVVPESYEPQLQHGPTKILFAVDGSPASHQALLTGMTLAARGAHLRALFVLDRTIRFTDVVPVDVREEALVDQREEGKRALAAAAEVFTCLAPSFPADYGFLHTKRSGDDIAHTLVREAVRWPADLLVMGTHGRRGVAGWVLGSVSNRVARITATPLLLVRAAADHAESHGETDTPTVEIRSLWSQS